MPKTVEITTDQATRIEGILPNLVQLPEFSLQIATVPARYQPQVMARAALELGIAELESRAAARKVDPS